jgi:hypothetical protein
MPGNYLKHIQKKQDQREAGLVVYLCQIGCEPMTKRFFGYAPNGVSTQLGYIFDLNLDSSF